jgi:hypothetical protein
MIKGKNNELKTYSFTPVFFTRKTMDKNKAPQYPITVLIGAALIFISVNKNIDISDNIFRIKPKAVAISGYFTRFDDSSAILTVVNSGKKIIAGASNDKFLYPMNADSSLNNMISISLENTKNTQAITIEVPAVKEKSDKKVSEKSFDLLSREHLASFGRYDVERGARSALTKVSIGTTKVE